MSESSKFAPNLKFIENLRDLAKDGYVFQYTSKTICGSIMMRTCLDKTYGQKDNEWKSIKPDDLIFDEFVNLINKGILKAECYTTSAMINFTIDPIIALNISKTDPGVVERCEHAQKTLDSIKNKHK